MTRLLVMLAGLLIAGGLCYLRLDQTRERRAERVEACHAALAEALSAEPGAARRAPAFAAARQAAIDAQREAPVGLDPYPVFLLRAIELLEAASAQPAPPPPALRSPLDAVAWLIAHGQLTDARARLEALQAEAARRHDGDQAERVALYLRLLSGVEAHAPPSAHSPAPDP